jgi:large subunit ribosomal protein L18
MNTQHKKGRIRRQIRIRAKIKGTKIRPRLCVFRSSKHIYAQIIDDENQKTIVGVHPNELKIEKGKKTTKTEKAALLGELIAKKALEKKLKVIVFDRNGYIYKGRVKALADGARKGGLQF